MRIDFTMWKKFMFVGVAMLGTLMTIAADDGGKSDGKKRDDLPLEARQRMARTRMYRGIWGVSSGYDIIVLQFDSCGKGVLSGGGGLFQAVFNWVADDKNDISCVLDPDYFGVEALDDLRKDRQKFVVRYLPESNVMKLGNDEIFGKYEKSRSLPFVSGEPRVQDTIKMFEKARQREEDKRQEYWNDKICETATKRCERIEALLETLSKETNCFSRIISVKTGVKGLVDRFMLDNEYGISFAVELEFARVDVGKRPAGLDERMVLPDVNFQRPDTFPPPTVTYTHGIKAVKELWKGFDPKEDRASVVLRSGHWRACKDEIVLMWSPDEGKEKEIVKALETRFKGRFPCDIDILTIRKKPGTDK